MMIFIRSHLLQQLLGIGHPPGYRSKGKFPFQAVGNAVKRLVQLGGGEQSAQVAAGRYREGVGSIIDLLTAQSALASARAQQVQARWQWYTSLAQLARDAGVLGVRGETPFPFSADSTVSRSAPTPATK